jgi:serine O-acetyltransferase
VPILPRAISYFGRTVTGVEIHPAAKIGRRFFIDHATGVVIGETSEIGDNVMMYHGVTLGGRGWWEDEKGQKRHPTVMDDVVIGVGATIIGPVTIGKNSIVGAGAIVTKDVPENSVVISPKARTKVVRRKGY